MTDRLEDARAAVLNASTPADSERALDAFAEVVLDGDWGTAIVSDTGRVMDVELSSSPESAIALVEQQNAALRGSDAGIRWAAVRVVEAG